MNTFTRRARRLGLLLIFTGLITATASAADFYVATTSSFADGSTARTNTERWTITRSLTR